MPSLTRTQLANLYVAVCAAVHGAITNKGRAKPSDAARIAHRRALAAVEMARINGERK